MERKQIRKVEKAAEPQYHLDEDDMTAKIAEYDGENHSLKIAFANNSYRVTYRDGRVVDYRILKIMQKTIPRISFTVQVGREMTQQNGQDDYQYAPGEILWYSKERMMNFLRSLENVVEVEFNEEKKKD